MMMKMNHFRMSQSNRTIQFVAVKQVEVCLVDNDVALMKMMMMKMKKRQPLHYDFDLNHSH